MDGLGQQLFAGAGFALDQDTDIGTCSGLGLLQQGIVSCRAAILVDVKQCLIIQHQVLSGAALKGALLCVVPDV